ncbi:unnamed protein product [Gadus morhua 'NCC']
MPVTAAAYNSNRYGRHVYERTARDTPRLPLALGPKADGCIFPEAVPSYVCRQGNDIGGCRGRAVNEWRVGGDHAATVVHEDLPPITFQTGFGSGSECSEEGV